MNRNERLQALVDEHGCASECDLPLSGGYTPRYALMEADEGSADNGGPWWNIGDDPHELLAHSAAQEYADDWPARSVFDLDTGQEHEVALAYEVDIDPPAPLSFRTPHARRPNRLPRRTGARPERRIRASGLPARRPDPTTRKEPLVTPIPTFNHPPDYQDAIDTARRLIDPSTPPEDGSPEYVRGQVALIAELFGTPEMDVQTRMQEVARDIGVELDESQSPGAR